MSRKQLKLGVPYSNAMATFRYNSSNGAPAVSRVRGRMSVSLSRARETSQALRPPQRERTMSSFRYGASDGSGYENQDQDTLSLSDQSGSTEPTPERSNPFPPSPIYIQDSPDLRVDKPSTKNASLSPVRLPTCLPVDQKLGMSSPSEEGGDGPSLASWLVPQVEGNRRKRPHKNKGSLDLQANAGTKEAFPRRQWGPWAVASGKPSGGAREGSGDGRLSAWLEPGGEPAVGKKRAKAAGGNGKVDAVVQRSSEQSDEEETDSGKWMSERLGGLDPSGEARAKDSWTYRERRNLTSTDIALASTKRKAKRPRGWKTEAGGGKVFVAPSRSGARGGARGGAALASGQAAVRTSRRGGGKRGVAQR